MAIIPSITWGLGNPPYVIVTKSDGSDIEFREGQPVTILHDGVRLPCVVDSIGTRLEPKIIVWYFDLIPVHDLNQIYPRPSIGGGSIGGKRRTRGRKGRTRRRTRRTRRTRRNKRVR